MAMFDYIERITAFLKNNFEPGATAAGSNFKHTTEGLLDFLFRSFPENCISDFELVDILLELGYTQQTWVQETPRINKRGKVTRIDKELVTGWLINSCHDLQPEEFDVKEESDKKEKSVLFPIGFRNGRA